jgi:hypothetical protein
MQRRDELFGGTGVASVMPDFKQVCMQIVRRHHALFDHALRITFW